MHKEKNERRLDGRPDEMNHEGGWWCTVSPAIGMWCIIVIIMPSWNKEGWQPAFLPCFCISCVTQPSSSWLDRCYFEHFWTQCFFFLGSQSQQIWNLIPTPALHATKPKMRSVAFYYFLESWLTLVMACNNVHCQNHVCSLVWYNNFSFSFESISTNNIKRQKLPI